MGKTLDEAMKITPKLVADELEGLPTQKFHCSNLGAQALHKAIKDYLGKKKAKGGKKYWQMDVRQIMSALFVPAVTRI